jgi:hypothetical protein
MKKKTKTIEVNARSRAGDVTYRLRNLAEARKTGHYEWNMSWPGHAITEPLAYDLLEIGKAIHLSDRAVRRSLRYGRRTREFHLKIPVLQPEVWRPAAQLLESLAGFASADVWKIDFTTVSGRRQAKTQPPKSQPGVIALFSGGLDSLCGAAYLAKTGAKPIFVTHSPPGRKSSLSLLREVWKAFGREELGRDSCVTFRLEIRERTHDGLRSMFQEPTRRTRPFFFLSLACAVALQLGVTNVQMAENGAFALSLPVRADAHGALCSRQAHAYLLEGFRQLLQMVAPWLGSVRIYNPFEELTKGEACRRYLEKAASLANKAVSCEYVGRQAAFLRAWREKKYPALASELRLGSGPQCGLCLPCLVRRAALYKNNEQIDDPDDLYFFNARRVRDWYEGGEKSHNGYRLSKTPNERPPLYDAVAPHVYHVRQFCERVLRMNIRAFAVQYLPELRLPQLPEFYSDAAVERRYRLVRRFAKELLLFLDAR